jgi:hypothetical protein
MATTKRKRTTIQYSKNNVKVLWASEIKQRTGPSYICSISNFDIKHLVLERDKYNKSLSGGT